MNIDAFFAFNHSCGVIIKIGSWKIDFHKGGSIKNVRNALRASHKIRLDKG